jgi:anti-sigma factor RsiW
MNDPQLTLKDELLLQAYLDGELSPAEGHQFAARLTAEPALRAAYDQWLSLLAEFDGLPEPQLTRDLSAGVVRRLSPQMPTPVWRPLLLAQAAATILLALLAWPLLAVLTPTLPNWTPPDWAALMQGWQTAAGLWQLTLSRWAAAWQSAFEAQPLSLSLLLPLAALAAVIWFIQVGYLWRATPARR